MSRRRSRRHSKRRYRALSETQQSAFRDDTAKIDREVASYVLQLKYEISEMNERRTRLWLRFLDDASVRRELSQITRDIIATEEKMYEQMQQTISLPLAEDKLAKAHVWWGKEMRHR